MDLAGLPTSRPLLVTLARAIYTAASQQVMLSTPCMRVLTSAPSWVPLQAKQGPEDILLLTQKLKGTNGPLTIQDTGPLVTWAIGGAVSSGPQAGDG